MRPALVAALLLVGCAGPVGEPVPGPSTDARLLYLTEFVDGSGLVPIDPVTLQNLPRGPLLRSAAGEPNPCYGAYSGPCALVTASADARTLAVVGYAPTGASGVSVFDARTGVRRSRAVPDVPVIVDALSADGTRIYARAWPPRDLGAERLVLDASDGRIVEREPPVALGGDRVASVTDHSRRRLYALVVDSSPRATGPRDARLEGWDLHTGRELWRVGLSSLLAGEWPTGRVGNEGEIHSRLVPGLALSPDGRTLAIARAVDCCLARGALWLVDSSDGRLRAQRSYEKGASLIERLFAPSIAAAKDEEEVVVSATFSADGRVIYVYGESWNVPGTGGYRYLGMSAIDIESARVLGSDIKMERAGYDNHVHWVLPSPDGRWLYAMVQRTGNADLKGFMLRRLDARMLDVRAERGFDSYRYGFLLAAP